MYGFRFPLLLTSCHMLFSLLALAPFMLRQSLMPLHRETLARQGMTLDQIVAVYREACQDGVDVVRLHTGEPSLYGAIGEQMDALDRLGIEYEMVPGISSFQAAAAALKVELGVQSELRLELRRARIRHRSLDQHGQAFQQRPIDQRQCVLHVFQPRIAGDRLQLLPQLGDNFLQPFRLKDIRGFAERAEEKMLQHGIVQDRDPGTLDGLPVNLAMQLIVAEMV